jgi:hypothetical protein
MKYSKFFLILFLIMGVNWQSLCAAHDLETIARRIEHWWYSSRNREMRLIGSTLAGATSTIVGLLLIKKGIEQTLCSRPHAHENSSNTALIWHGVKNIWSRIAGCGIACLGVGITGSGIVLIACNKEIITYINTMLAKIQS